jgi:hypothetical protein
VIGLDPVDPAALAPEEALAVSRERAGQADLFPLGDARRQTLLLEALLAATLANTALLAAKPRTTTQRAKRATTTPKESPDA